MFIPPGRILRGFINRSLPMPLDLKRTEHVELFSESRVDVLIRLSVKVSVRVRVRVRVRVKVRV